MRNAYKRMNIFKCVHEAHAGFESQMSVHHIMNEKGCFPHGCFYFRWECKLMKQGKPCYRGYNFMGKNCHGCRHFYEEKVHNRSELQISETEYQEFQRELVEFEDWLEEHRGKEWEIHGKIDGVKPLFNKRVYGKGESFVFRGFLLIFKELFIERERIEDHVYIRLSPKTYASLKFGAGDVITARATLDMDRGRLVMHRLRRIDIEQRGEAPLWNESKALVARETATHIPLQPEGCIQCPFGSLIDVEDRSAKHSRRYRELYCLKGMKDHRKCHDYVQYCGFDEEGRDAGGKRNAACSTQKVINVNFKF